MRSTIRGVLAALLLLILSIGLPIAIAATIGNPITHWSGASTSTASDTQITALLGAIFWLAWLSFVIPAALEITITTYAALTRRPRRDYRIPVLGGQQQLARTLISAALVLIPAGGVASAASSTPAAPTVTIAAATTTTHSSSPIEGQHNGAAAPQEYVIPDHGGMRSYWALAEYYLGDGTRWRKIWDLNQGRVHHDGTVMDSPTHLCAGWTVLIPAETPHEGPQSTDHLVQSGDTLSTIAADHDLAWPTVWALNKDRPEPDGARLTNPNELEPGWTIRLPDSPTYAAPRPRGNESPSGQPPASRDQRTQLHPRGDSATSLPPNSEPATSPAGTTRPTSAPTSPPPAEVRRAPHHEIPIALEVSLAALAALTVLDRARRIAQRRRRPGHRIAAVPAHLRETEASIRQAARRGSPVVAAIQLATELSAQHPVRVSAVTARTDGAVDLHLAEPGLSAPPPFTEITSGWRLPAQAAGFIYGTDDTTDPYPLLVPVGTTSGGQVLIDLERHDPVSVAGAPAAVQRFLTRLAAAVSGSEWSDRVQVHVPTELATDLRRLERVTVDAQSPSLPSTAPSSSTEVDPRWRTTPIYLYLGWPSSDVVAPAISLAAESQSNIQIIVNGACTGTEVWTLDGDQLTVPGLDQTVTVGSPEPDEHTVAELLEHVATAPDVPADDPTLPNLTEDMPPNPATTGSQINVLGPVELTGPTELRRGMILELLVYLALHRRGVQRQQILGALWPDRTPPSKTMRNRLIEARTAVNGAVSDGPIWRLDPDVTTDWQQFLVLAAGSTEQQHDALALIRGRPFEGLDNCEWLDLDGHRSEVEARIVDVALGLSETELASGHPEAALSAARAGLRASRYEERLHRLAIRAATASNMTGVVRTLKQEMRRALDLDIEPDDAIQPETLELYAAEGLGVGKNTASHRARR